MERRTIFVIANDQIETGKQSAEDRSRALWDHILRTDWPKRCTPLLDKIYTDLRELVGALENVHHKEEQKYVIE